MAVYLLLPRAFVFYLGMGPYIQGKSSGRIRRDISSQSGLRAVLGMALLSTCKVFLRWTWEPSRVASPARCMHRNSVKPWAPICVDHTCLSAKNCEMHPLCMFINLCKAYIHILLY